MTTVLISAFPGPTGDIFPIGSMIVLVQVFPG